MPYRLTTSDSDAETALRRIAAEQTDAALAAAAAGSDPRTGPHEARKACKKLRALLRLAGPAFEGRADEDRAIRDAARRLSPLRQCGAGLETLERLVAARGAEIGAAAARAARTVLTERAEAPPEGDAGAALAAFRADMAALRARVTDWRPDKTGLRVFADGAEASYRAARKRMTQALRSPTPQALHDWRKRAKDHWYHARLLEPVAPELLGPRIAAAARLTDLLGDHQDLVDFTDLLDDGTLPGMAATALRAPVAAEMARLAAAALARGPGLFRQKPGALGREWRGWLKGWGGRRD